MKSNYKQLGQFIRQVDIRNTDGKEDNLLGVSVQKKFIPSIANTVGTDFRKYKIVKRGQFTYIPDTSRRGDKIAIALLLDYEEGIVSNVYTVFEVIDENQLLSEYLMLWFMRPEFDRYARFKSHGSVREVMDWDEMCKVELPVPEIEKQRQIVNAYNTINDRIALKRKINDNLDATINAFFTERFSRFLHEDMNKMPDYVQLRDFIKIKHGYAFDGEQFSENKTSKILVSPGNFKIGGGFQNSKPKFYNEKATYKEDYVLEAGSLVVTMTDLSKNGDTLGFPAIIPDDKGQTFLHNQRVGLVEFIDNTYSKAFIYYLMRSNDYRNYILATSSGTTVRHTSPNKILGYGFISPDNDDDILILNSLFKVYLSDCNNLNNEIQRLSELQSALLSKLVS